MNRIIHISDTHSHHRKLDMPPGDLLIHSGDITRVGELDTIKDFCDWVKDLHYTHSICVMGNHELKFDRPGPKKQKALELFQEAGIVYLEDTSVEIDGLKIHGSPISVFYHDWAYNRMPGPEIQRHWDMIPNDTNILITHTPVWGILDEVPREFGEIDNIGCKDLLEKIKYLKDLKLHCAGHCHEGYAAKPVEVNGVLFSNASICRAYPNKGFNEPVVIDI
jgi:Icc-related predicted phosphoesterase